MTELTDGVLVFLLAGGQGERLYPLTRDRAKPAVPFGGHYRIIDFTLTNCIHSGLRRVFVFTQYRSLSLERHLKNGYDFLPRAMDEFIDAVPPQFRSQQWYMGTADAVYQNVYLLEKDRPKRVLVLSGDHVYRLDYRDMIRYHAERNATMTIGVIEVPLAEATRMGVLTVDEEFRVIGFDEKPAQPKPIPGRPDVALASMGIYLFETNSLVREVSWDAKRESAHDFGKDVVPHMVASGVPVHAFPFREPGGERPAYWRDVGTIDAYFEAHGDLLGDDPAFRLRDDRWPLFTVMPRLPAAELRSSPGKSVEVVDTVLSAGVVVKGARVVRSFIGPDVRVEPGAVLEDTILLGRCTVGECAHLRKVVVDKDVNVPAGQRIGLDAEADAKEFLRSAGGVTVIAAATRLE